MSEESLNPIVYSKQVIEFVTVANEFCNFLETVGSGTAKSFIDTVHKVLPLLYLKTAVLPPIESFEEMGLEKFVSEVDYNFLQQKVMNLLGEYDDFQEVFDPEMQFSDAPLTSSISECMADIYQDLKDFLMSYRTGDDLVMQEALWICMDNFKTFWGQRLVNSLRAIHSLAYGDVNFDDQASLSPSADDDGDDKGHGNKPDWLNQRFMNQGD